MGGIKVEFHINVTLVPDGGMIGLQRAVNLNGCEWRESSPANGPVDSEDRRFFFANFRVDRPDNQILNLRYEACLLDSIYVTAIYINRTVYLSSVNWCSLYRKYKKLSESIKNRIDVS